MAPPKSAPVEDVPLPEQVETWMLTLASAPPLAPEAMRRVALVAAWRAAGAALSGDAAKAPAAAAAASEALQASHAPAEPDSGPVGEEEVVRAVRLAVRRGLESADPKRVAEAVALWRAERAWVDPEGLAGAGAADAEAMSETLLAAADAAREQALAMERAGAVGV